jgi:hypothetical protein
MKIFNDEAKAWIKDYVEKNYDKIDVMSGKLLWNYNCHRNAVHHAIEHSDNELIMSIYFDGDCPVIHFLNIDKNGKYVDNTLGYWSSQYPYYIIKTIKRNEFFNIDNIFGDYRIEIGKKMPLYLRLFSDYRA